MGTGDVPASIDHDHECAADCQRRDDAGCAGYDSAANSEDEEKCADKLREPRARRIHARIESDSILSEQSSFLTTTRQASLRFSYGLAAKWRVTGDEDRDQRTSSSLITGHSLAAGVFRISFAQLLNDFVRFGSLAGTLIRRGCLP